MAPLEADAAAQLLAAWGLGERTVSARCPGRCTLVGDHVDYAGGMVLSCAIDLEVAVAVRRSPDGVYRASALGTRVERTEPRSVGDVADRIIAAGVALRRRGIDVAPFEAATSATLPDGAGLASSAATICATTVALVSLVESRIDSAGVVDTAFVAEHDVVGVPCGRLDQHAVVEAPRGGALLFDARADTASIVPWTLHEHVLCVCDTAERHSVAGPEYRRRRVECAEAFRRAGIRTAQDSMPGTVRDVTLQRRLRHVLTETRRSVEAADAVRSGDAARLGELMIESHASLRDDYAVSTATLDAVATAAHAIDGCLGARMVGGGFGGSVLALVHVDAAHACARAMVDAAGGAPARSWVLRPAPGLAVTQAHHMGGG
ncbi:MAG: galactokinase [Candidatus Dormibacteria bacterium]